MEKVGVICEADTQQLPMYLWKMYEGLSTFLRENE